MPSRETIRRSLYDRREDSCKLEERRNKCRAEFAWSIFVHVSFRLDMCSLVAIRLIMHCIIYTGSISHDNDPFLQPIWDVAEFELPAIHPEVEKCSRMGQPVALKHLSPISSSYTDFPDDLSHMIIPLTYTVVRCVATVLISSQWQALITLCCFYEWW